MPELLTHNGEIFIWTGGFATKETPKAAGFRWNPKAKHWWTDRVEKAARLYDYADSGTRVVLDSTYKFQQESKVGSWAEDSNLEAPSPDGLEYRPFQKAGIEYAVKRKGTLIADEMGTGKALPLDAKILTPHGFVEMKDINLGDKIIGKDGRPIQVIGVYPQGEKDIYRVVFSDGSSTECCEDHLWEVNTSTRNRRGNYPFVKSVREIKEEGLFYFSKNKKKSKWQIPIVVSVKMERQDVPIDPWLLGVLLGDGCFRGIGVTFTSIDQVLINRVKSSLHEELKVVYHKGCAYGISGQQGKKNILKFKLKKLGLWGKDSHTKFIPEIYKNNSEDIRLEILRGLMDTDGTVTSTGSIVFSVVSEDLIDGVIWLVQSLGGVATKSSYNSEKYGIVYRSFIRMPKEVNPFWLKRKADKCNGGRKRYQAIRSIVEVKYSRRAQAQCIKVDSNDGLFVINDCIVTHNTIQAAGVINYLGQVGNFNNFHILIVCPASLVLNWEKELRKWVVDTSLKISVVGKEWPDVSNIYICSYNKVIKYSGKDNQGKLHGWKWDLVVLDESHKVKNYKAQRTQALLGLNEHWSEEKKAANPDKWKPAIKADWRLALTGTPILNRPIEIQKVLSWLDEVNWGNMFQFGLRYCAGEQTDYGWDFTGNSNLEELQERLRETVMIRRLKKDVLKELPPKQRQVILLPLEGAKWAVKEEQKAWEAQEDRITEARLRVEMAKASEDPKDYEEAVEAMKQAMEVAFTEMSKARYKTAMAKLPMCTDHIFNALENEGKVIVFAYHHDVVDSLMNDLAEFNPVKIVGGMSDVAKEKAKETFQEDENCRVIIGSLGAMSEGHTLTASSTVIFVELDWVPANLTQAEDRAHRIGQTDKVNVQHLVLDGSLDAKIANFVVEKQEIIDKSMDMHVDGTIPVVPDVKPAVDIPSPKRIEKEAEVITDEESFVILTAIRTVAGYCDGALELDGTGFNKFDAKFGHHLASLSRLSAKQAVIALRMANKYRGQLDSALKLQIIALKQKVGK